MRPIAHDGGSQQLRILRRALRDGMTPEQACEATGGVIDLAEAKIYIAADAAFPPPPEAFELLGQTKKETTMASAAQQEDGVEIVHEMDFDTAMKIVKNDIMPANAKSGEFAQEASTAYKAIKKNCHIQPSSVKAAIQIANKEDAKRDDYLRGMCEMVNRLTGETLLTFHSNDLVDQAEGKPGRSKPKLATLGGVPAEPQQSDGTETDLADGEEGDSIADGFDEASEEELAQQEGRGKKSSADLAMKSGSPEAVN